MERELTENLRAAFNKASLLINNKLIDKNEFISKNSDKMLKLLTDSNKERGIILHPGTCLLLYLSIILASFKSFLSDDSDIMSFLDELAIGELVLYDNKRGEYKGRDDLDRIIIENYDRGTLTTNRVPVLFANKITPYYGSAKTLDGRGVRNKNTTLKFISTLFDLKIKDIKSITNKSIIVVCEKQEADRFIECLSIEVNKKCFRIGQLFPSAYYTPSDIYYYSGNSAKVEPIIKFTNKLSVARELIIENKGIETLVIDGTKYFSEDISEVSSIYNRSSLKTIMFLGEMQSGIESTVFQSFENLQSYIWTKEHIGEISLGHNLDKNVFCEESVILQKMLHNTKNYKFNIVEKESVLDHRKFYELKKLLHTLIKQRESNEKINSFIIKGYWLLNLLERSFFPLSVMEKLISEGQINALSPAKELENMQNIVTEFNDSIFEERMKEIVITLKHIKTEMDTLNPKYNYLSSLLNQYKYKRIKMAVMCDKTYYQKIFNEAIPAFLKESVEKIDFCTPNKFKTNILYQIVIVIGILDWSKLNPLLLSNANEVTFLLYPNEIKRIKLAESQTKKKLHLLRNYSQEENKDEFLTGIHSDLDELFTNNEELEERNLEREIEKYINHFSLHYVISELKTGITGGLQTSEIKRVAFLETGEKVFFTQYYSPYVFEVESQAVIETDVSSLKPGDLLIFTNFDTDTRDIVERVLDLILESENCDESFRESYKKSFYWKQVLKEYMNSNNFTFHELSEWSKKFGKRKHEVTLRSWLDEKSHIVGPRESESFQMIAKMTNDKRMIEDPNSFHEACREVRSMRIRILKYIGKNIIRTYNKNYDISNDEIFSELPIDISNMSRLIQIDRIMDVNNLIIPSYNTNRPQNI
ncbi:DrmE family protein [Neobacillus sp. WH10]|uniref:DrmE family protein n=1 Tax=Neobacillus sp. WH10 TaxID=3047873 RepID=UPI0024C143D5|nr:DrmE family protein [Neobacillus sp. WH10]WHY78382.1 DrmE family protein [Neobacillus sp. WH10]